MTNRSFYIGAMKFSRIIFIDTFLIEGTINLCIVYNLYSYALVGMIFNFM
jgi:hypothetical protein